MALLKMDKTPYAKLKIIILVVVLLLVGLFGAWRFISKQTVLPPVSEKTPAGTSAPTPPLPPPPSVFSGNVINISQENQTITLGTYRIENNKAVLASTKVFKFNNDTVFTREQISKDKLALKDKISVGGLKVGNLVEAEVANAAGDLVAKKIMVLQIPPPSQKP